MSIYIGGSCVGYGNTTPETTVNEIRFVIKTDIHSAHNWEWVDKSLASKTKMIINIESHTRGWSKGWESEANLRIFTESILTRLTNTAYNKYGITLGKLKRFCRITFDNEADEIYSPYEYGYYLDIFHSQVAGRFDIGAGNFSNNRKDYYEYICRIHKSSFNVLDIHMQTSWETKSKIAENAKWYRDLATKYVKRLSCTEANDTRNNIWTASGFDILHYQLVKAVEIGCEDFCVIFIKQPDDNKYANQSFIRNNGSKSPYWDSFKKMIADNKPKPLPKPIIEGRDGMIIQTQTMNNYERYLAQLENELLWKLGYLKKEDIAWSVTQKTVDALKEFQNSIVNKYPNIIIDGKCGRQMFRYLAQEIPDSIERANYRFAIELYASPTK